jgi:predicted N-acetyltransferase YhbS
MFFAKASSQKTDTVFGIVRCKTNCSFFRLPGRLPGGEELAVFLVREEIPADVAGREALLDVCFGPNRFAKTSERIREGRLPAEGLSLSAVADGRLVGTVRLWHVSAGAERAALLLGPLAVDPTCQAGGIGSALMRASIAAATRLGHGAILLVGDAPYYARFGFGTERTGALWMPGPFERERFLGLELRPQALLGARGLIRPTGVRVAPERVAVPQAA